MSDRARAAPRAPDRRPSLPVHIPGKRAASFLPSGAAMADQPQPTPTPPADEPEAADSRPACNLTALFDGILDNPTADDDEED